MKNTRYKSQTALRKFIDTDVNIKNVLLLFLRLRPFYKL